MSLPSNLERFLAEPRIAVLATVRRDGAPATTACWYDLQDGQLLMITMYRDARRLPNIQHNPHVAVTIIGEDPYQHLSLAGRVTRMWDDPALEVWTVCRCATRAIPGRSASPASAHSSRSNAGTPTACS